MKNYLSIIRWPNLVIMALSMYLVRYCIILPAIASQELMLVHSLGLFSLLVLSIILLAAGGNIINDIQDVAADKINKPGINRVDDFFSYKTAYQLYYSITTIGLLLGLLVSYYLGSFLFFNIHVVIGLLLWMYSSRWNNIPLLGNVVVSSLLASLPWIVLFFDLPSIIFSIQNEDNTFALPAGGLMNFQSFFTVILFLVLSYSLFAYLQNLAREITKDIVDVEGDRHVGYRTSPTIFGINSSKRFILGIHLLSLVVYIGFLYIISTAFERSYPLRIIVMGACLILPTLYSIFLLSRSQKRADYKKLSNWNKISQLLGLLTTLYFLYL